MQFDMDKVTVLLVSLILGGSHAFNRHTTENTHNGGGINVSPRSRCIHAINAMRENNEAQASTETQNNVTASGEGVDPNPSKIPSLMDPSDSIGLLRPSEIDLADRCFPAPQCDSDARFRTIDGGCNNLLFPVWGQTNTANSRIIQAHYSDGIDQPRKSISGRELPNSRRIRTTLFKDLDRPAPKHSLFAMQFGQVIAHDTEFALPKTTNNGSTLECCKPDGTSLEILPKRCLPIITPHDDPGSKNQCFTVPATLDTADRGCNIKPVRQIIGVTSYLDASMTYGSDDDTANSLRTFVNGKLRKQMGQNGRSFLPNTKKGSRTCTADDNNAVCYMSGDLFRVNIHPDQVVQSISLLRLHNLLCDELKKINPSWKDERLYQEARRLLIGMYQHITYNEFVPILVGKDYARVNNLLPSSEGFDNNYDKFLNPTTISSFTAAAYRSLHSYIPGFFNLVNEARKVTSKIRLSDYYFKTNIVQRKDNYDSFLRGLLTQHSQEQDQFFTKEVSDFLFRIPKKTAGHMDLVTLDLERGRDFGEPSYNKFRQLCGLKEARSFDDLIDQINKKVNTIPIERETNINALAKLYEHVNDIDYYAAGILEKPKPGSILGHTFQCIVGEMFFRWKFGDRFFYEFGYQPGSFSLDQLNEIRKTTLALTVCMTSDIQSIQRDAFDVPSTRNPLVPCNSIPKLNFTAWKEVH